MNFFSEKSAENILTTKSNINLSPLNKKKINHFTGSTDLTGLTGINKSIYIQKPQENKKPIKDIKIIKDIKGIKDIPQFKNKKLLDMLNFNDYENREKGNEFIYNNHNHNHNNSYFPYVREKAKMNLTSLKSK